MGGDHPQRRCVVRLALQAVPPAFGPRGPFKQGDGPPRRDTTQASGLVCAFGSGPNPACRAAFHRPADPFSARDSASLALYLAETTLGGCASFSTPRVPRARRQDLRREVARLLGSVPRSAKRRSWAGLSRAVGPLRRPAIRSSRHPDLERINTTGSRFLLVERRGAGGPGRWCCGSGGSDQYIVSR